MTKAKAMRLAEQRKHETAACRLWWSLAYRAARSGWGYAFFESHLGLYGFYLEARKAVNSR